MGGEGRRQSREEAKEAARSDRRAGKSSLMSGSAFEVCHNSKIVGWSITGLCDFFSLSSLSRSPYFNFLLSALD